MAASRRDVKSLPSHALSRRARSPSETTGGGSSGMWGGCIFAIGEAAISPSSTHHLKNCCSAR